MVQVCALSVVSDFCSAVDGRMRSAALEASYIYFLMYLFIPDLKRDPLRGVVGYTSQPSSSI